MSVSRTIDDAIAIAANEFRQFRRNRSAVLISLIILPLFFTVALGAGRGSAGKQYYPIANIPIAFVDQDNTPASFHFYQTLHNSEDFHKFTQMNNAQAAIAELGSEKIYAVIVVPFGFQNNLENGYQASIILYTDDSEPNLTSQIQASLTEYAQTFNPNLGFQPVLTPPLRESIGPIKVVDKSIIFPTFDNGLTIILGIVQIFACFYEIAGGFARDREDGTFARMIVSPIKTAALLFGKTMFDLVLATARTFIVVGIAIFVYHASPNAGLATILTLSLLLALLTMGLAFVVSSLKVSTRTVVIMEFFLVLSLFAFSGLVVDKDLLTGTAQLIVTYLPFSYGFDALRQTILVGRPLLSLTTDLQIIVGTTACFYIISLIMFAKFKERLAT
ncbi:MAG: ABC transporter permease [Candidatus Bathyarchaeia archaeon]